MPESGIRRATALVNLTGPFPEQQQVAVERGLRDADPLVRMAAAQVAPGLPPDRILQQLAPLLMDDVRSVRLAAVQSLAPARDYLPASSVAAFDRAADEYRAAQLAVASRPQAHGALAEFESRLGDIEAALAHADQAVAMAPEMALLRHSRGLLLVRADRHDEALAELRAATELAPEVARFSYVYAVALNSLGQPDAALEVLEQARVQHPDDPDIAAFFDMLSAD
jgi:tetratricopeptide (TPR) repeat protein